MFSDIATALCYDQRGSGHSDKSPPYDVATFVADLEALRQYWGFDRWVVGGHSWGANLVLAYALTHPGRCIGLLYVCGTGIDERWHGDYKKAQRAKLPAQEQLLLDRLEGQRTGLTATEAEANGQAWWHLLRKTDFFDPETLAKALLAANAWQPLVPGIRDLPALFLHGEADTRPYWPSQALAKQMEHAKVVVLPHAGHEVFVEQLEAFRDHVRGFPRSLLA